MTLHVTIDPELCIGSGSCVHLAPGAFALDHDGVADAINPDAVPGDRLRLAARSCPTGAISVEELVPDRPTANGEDQS
jgi:ferredoxin